MRKQSTIQLALCLLLAASPCAQARVEALFIGNSHTFYNDLPGLVFDLAQAGGQEIYVEQSTIGGYSLNQHRNYAPTLDKIRSRPWDHVVLQEHSQYPMIPHYRDNYFYPAARVLDEFIHLFNGSTSFFMTWGYEFGEQHCIGEYCSPDYADYWEMQVDVTAAYEAISGELDAFLVPVGRMWSEALREDGKSPLWNDYDHYHPSPEGSYLAACTFYARFFDESPEGLEFYGAIDPERARFYQRIAGRVVTGAEETPAPESARLLPCHPNPFNPVTTLSFALPRDCEVRLEFFAADGRLVDRIDAGQLGAGRHDLRWDAGDLPAGVYLCRLSAGDAEDSRKLTLLK